MPISLTTAGVGVICRACIEQPDNKSAENANIAPTEIEALLKAFMSPKIRTTDAATYTVRTGITHRCGRREKGNSASSFAVVKSKEKPAMLLSNYKHCALRMTALVLAIIMVLGFSAARPVQAATAGQISTRNIILAGVALATAVILYNNYEHKQVAHNTVVGRTSDGGIVYADGRIVYPDGTVVYTSNDGRSRCSYDGYGVPCARTVRVYRLASDCDDKDDRGDFRDCRHDNGHHYGKYKHNHDND